MLHYYWCIAFLPKIVPKWHNLSPPLGIFCINVCCEIFYVDPSHIKFWIMLLISLIAFVGMLNTLETYK